MSLTIDTYSSVKLKIPSYSEEEARVLKHKGWSFSYVYNFSEIKDVFIALKQHSFLSLIEFTDYCQSINMPYVRTAWNKRRILEHLNALKNFGLITDDYRILDDVFEENEIGKPISTRDLKIFKNIYFSYFRFKEIHTWFINPIIENRGDFIGKLNEDYVLKNSKALYSFSQKSRFTDSYLLKLETHPEIYYIDIDTREDLMRFWDVFTKWGLSLGLLEKFNLRNLGIKTIDNKGISCCYFVKALDFDFNLLDFVNQNYSESYIYIPELVLKLATKFRARIDDIHLLIISQYKLHKEFISFERTSEIFVKKQDINKGDKIFFLKYNDSYISHLIIRK